MTIFKHDTFTVATDTLLTNHTSETGGGWTGIAGHGNFTVEASSNKLRYDTTAIRVAAMTGTPPNADYASEIIGATLGTMVSGSVIGVCARQAGPYSSSVGYNINLRGNDGWRLVRVDTDPSWAENFLAFDVNFIANKSIGTGTLIGMRLEVETTDASTVQLRAYIKVGAGEWELVSTYNDTHANRITDAHRPGVYMNGTNPRIDEYTAETLDPTGMIVTEPLEFIERGTGTAILLSNRTGIEWTVRNRATLALLGNGTSGTTNGTGNFVPDGENSFGDPGLEVELKLRWVEGDPAVNRSLFAVTTLVAP